MEAWAASMKGIHFPTLSNKLALDMKMGEIVISVSIRASSLEVGSFSVTDKMTGFMEMMKNTYELASNA
jgi:hypothetical protein